MLSLRTRLFIVGTGIILIILAISVLLLVQSRNKNTTGGTQNATTTTSVLNNASINQGQNQSGQNNQPQGFVRPRTTEEIEQNAAKQAAKIFVERYNSYSTQNNYDNVREVQSIVTSDLWKQIGAKLGGGQGNAAFVGVTTQVMVATIQNWKITSTDIVLQAVREIEKNGEVTREHANITVSLIKNGSNWLVNSFAWEK